MAGESTFSERILEAGALQAVAAAVQRHGLGRNLMLVCDDTTWVAAGQQLNTLLSTDHDCLPHSLGRHPKASLSHVEPILISAQAQGVDGIIAVGSGTVNDVAKYAAHLLHRPYISVATAASMNGYSSANASLESQGHKQSYRASAPKAVVADLNVIAAAPRRLAKAGLGDTLCRGTVAADRYLSHVVMGTPFEGDLFKRLRVHEEWLLANAPLLNDNRHDYLTCLLNALLDVGDAMHEAESSAVASQGEHMIAHTMEMLYGSEMRHFLHGEMVAVTTISMAHLQHKMLLTQPQVKSHFREEALFTRHFGKKLGLELAELYAKKVISSTDAMDISDRLLTDWPAIKAELAAMMATPNLLERAFTLAGLNYKPEAIQMPEDRYSAAANIAYLTRDRFTFLDLAVMNNRRI